MSKINDTKELPEDIFPINFKIIDQYQWKDPSLKDKYEMGKYQKGSFRRVGNINISLITCDDEIFIPSILQNYVLNFYHAYITEIDSGCMQYRNLRIRDIVDQTPRHRLISCCRSKPRQRLISCCFAWFGTPLPLGIVQRRSSHQ